MSKTSLLDAKTQSFTDILGNGKLYFVPVFQRDYSWEDDHLEDLWNDILSIYDGSSETHYMGSVVLQIKGDARHKQFWIIDGQQRFTTLSLFTLAIIQQLDKLAEAGIDPEANKERKHLLIQQYIGQKDPSSLLYSSKIKLNENNDNFYQQRLIQFRPPVAANKLNDSEKLLWNAFLFFQTKIEALFKQETNGEKIAELLKTVGESLKFIQITVEDELNAFTVFETLNSRREELTPTDLLKNYLFSLVAKSEHDLQIVKSQWKKIIDMVGLKKFPTFLLYYLNSRSPLVSKDQLFKTLKRTVKTDQEVLALLDQLESNAYIFNALSDPEDEIWQNDRAVREYIDSLNLFKVSVCTPLLMIAKEKMDFGEFRKLLRGIVSISFRYNVIAKLQTNEMERSYNRAAIAIYDGRLSTAGAVLDHLSPLYISDEQFKSYFEIKTFITSNTYDRKIARYVLYKLEAQMDGIKTDYRTDDGTIEHILPENMDEHWAQHFTDEAHQNAVYLLGNLTLLEAKLNQRQAERRPFEEKKAVYATSKYALSQQVTAPDWQYTDIKNRQRKLANYATAIWKR